MPQAHKVLGQSNPAATTLTSLYTAGSGVQSILSSIVICNQGSTSATYRLAVRPAGASIASQHYLVFDAAIPANDSVCLTLGACLSATDVLSVYASNTSISFTAFGVEIT